MRIVDRYRGRDLWLNDEEYRAGRMVRSRKEKKRKTVKFPVKKPQGNRYGYVSIKYITEIAHSMIDNILDSNIKPEGYEIVKRRQL